MSLIDGDKLKNWDFIGRCFDILVADPFRIEDGAKLRTVFVASEDEDFDSTPDGRAKKPIWTRYRAVTGGMGSVDTTTVSSAHDFQKSSEVEVSISASDAAGQVFKASLSNSFKNAQTLTQSNAKTITYASQTVNLYSLDLDMRKIDKLSDEIMTAIDGLNLAGDDNEGLLDAFLDEFGTHYSSAVLFGGKAFQRTVVAESEYSSLIESGVNIKSDVEMTLKLAVGAMASSSDQRSDLFKRASRSSSEKVDYVGGTPQSMFDMWAGSVEDRPAPISVRLTPLDDLLQDRFFPDDDAIDLKRGRLKAAIEGRLKRMGHDVGQSVLAFGDTVRLRQVVREPARELAARASDGRVFTAVSEGVDPPEASRWTIRPASDGGAVDGVLGSGKRIALINSAAGWLDARAGVDDRYDRGSGLVACMAGSPTGAASAWTIVHADTKERKELVVGDYVRLQSAWLNEDGYKGYLKSEPDIQDKVQRVYSFGKPHDQGVVWRLSSADDDIDAPNLH